MLTSEHFTTTIIGVADLACAIRVAQEQARSGTQLIELCGGFTHVSAGQEPLLFDDQEAVFADPPASLTRHRRLVPRS
jgi:hypothetical protein